MLEPIILGVVCCLMGLTLWNNWLSVMDLLVPRDLTSPHVKRMRPLIRAVTRVGGAIFTGIGLALLTFAAVKFIDRFMGV